MKHFKLTTETKVNAWGVTLFRIELTADCKWGKKGDKGGWIESENLQNGNAWVYGNARTLRYMATPGKNHHCKSKARETFSMYVKSTTFKSGANVSLSNTGRISLPK